MAVFLNDGLTGSDEQGIYLDVLKHKVEKDETKTSSQLVLMAYISYQ